MHSITNLVDAADQTMAPKSLQTRHIARKGRTPKKQVSVTISEVSNKAKSLSGPFVCSSVQYSTVQHSSGYLDSDMMN